jgi:hypothetical protein
MSERILPFPPRAILITSAAAGGWTVTSPRLQWLHVERQAAQSHAAWLADAYGLPVREMISSATADAEGTRR